jgi:transcriptional regulator with XRE-family HTH domain
MRRVVMPFPVPEAQPLLDAETFGAFVRASRTSTGMGIHEAAAFCGVAVGTMQKIEKASGDVKLSSILTVCKMLGIPLTIGSRVNP